MRYTKSTLAKIEQALVELSYTVRYEKGHFQSGYCIVQNKKMVIVNKFFDTEGRINCLLDMLSAMPFPEENTLSETTRKWLMISKNREELNSEHSSTTSMPV